MRISDWSSDVCSSYLCLATLCAHEGRIVAVGKLGYPARLDDDVEQSHVGAVGDRARLRRLADDPHLLREGADEPADDDGNQGVLDVDGQLRLDLPGEVAGVLALDIEVFDERHGDRSEEHTSELQSLMRISYAVFCLKKKK